MTRDESTIVVGANGLIGSRTVGALLERQALPICVDLGPSPSIAVRGAFENAKREPVYFETNVCEGAEMQKLISALRTEFPGASSVVNVAYPRLPTFGRSPFVQDSSAFAANVAFHLAAYFNVFKEFGAYFADKGGGKVISFSSIYGFFLPRPELYAGTDMTVSAEYVAAKAAIIQLNKYYAKLYRAKGVSFNSISPGGIFDNQNPAFVRRYGQHTSSGSLLSVSPVVNAILFLLSDMATAITGQNLVVDEGFTL